MQTIRTKWHKIIPLIETRQAYITAPKAGLAAHLSEYQIDDDMIKHFVEGWGQLPKFVIDAELMQLARDKDYLNSLTDMKKAGVLRLPFPAMIVEFESATNIQSAPGGYCHYIAVLRDQQAEGLQPWEPEGFVGSAPATNKMFYGFAFRLQRDENGEYLVLSPSISFVEPEDRDGEPWVGVGSQGWLETKPYSLPLTQALDNVVSATYEKDAGVVWHALIGAALLMNTAGIKKEVIEPTKLNRRRQQQNKPLIPRHTYIRIGHVYKHDNSTQAEAYEPRRSPRPHWRRGHIRNVSIGKGRTGTKRVYIQPKLVAYHGVIDQEPTQQHEYVVTR